MTFAEFRNALCILTSIDRYELEAAGVIDVPKGQGVFPGCLDEPNAIWRRFQTDPYRWLLRADDETAAKIWSIIERRTKKKEPRNKNRTDCPRYVECERGTAECYCRESV